MKCRNQLTSIAAMLCGLAVFDATACVAGPPFVTDDPVPTDYRGWEIYTGFQYDNAGSGAVNASIPFAEFNYGAMPNVQISASFLTSQTYSATLHASGYGATDFGVKTRFVQESDRSPQISFYPSVEVPSQPGQHAVTLLPIWMQKSSGPWTAFGGGGVYLNAGPGRRDYTFVGGALERSVSPGTTIGGEIYHQSADTFSDRGATAVGFGSIFQIGRYHAILFSLGRAFGANDTFSAYSSYEFALGPIARSR